jgi:aspartate-semialdehyde dehydrogenase
MPALEGDSQRIVIAGAASLLGAELRSLLEESRFAGWDFRLVDEEVAAGTLAEAGGEPAVIQPVEEGTFARAKFVFFTGSPAFTRANLKAAERAGAKILDLSGVAAGQAATVSWFPKLNALRGSEFAREALSYAIPSAAGTAAAALALGLARAGLRRLTVVCLQAVSEAGRAGIEELESQTGQILSFQRVGHHVFGTQVAFNLLDRFAATSSQKLPEAKERVRAETAACLGASSVMPAIQLLHAPVFYGTALMSCAELDSGADALRIAGACEEAGFVIAEDDEATPSSVSVAGETAIHLAKPESDPAQPGTWWFWGAADNIRLPAANGVKLAEMLA